MHLILQRWETCPTLVFSTYIIKQLVSPTNNTFQSFLLMDSSRSELTMSYVPNKKTKFLISNDGCLRQLQMILLMHTIRDQILCAPLLISISQLHVEQEIKMTTHQLVAPLTMVYLRQSGKVFITHEKDEFGIAEVRRWFTHAGQTRSPFVMYYAIIWKAKPNSI